MSWQPERYVCWEIAEARTGEPYYAEHDVWPHFETKDHADEHIAAINSRRDDAGPLVARQCNNGRPCLLIVCDGCGEQFADEDTGVIHFEPGAVYTWVAGMLAGAEWTVTGDNHYGPDCAPPAGERIELANPTGRPVL